MRQARDGLAIAMQSQDMNHRVIAKAMAAEIFAWSGRPDDAMQLLEELATSIPGLPPAQIADQPLYAVPLADNARYQALKAKLEAQMAATKLE